MKKFLAVNLLLLTVQNKKKTKVKQFAELRQMVRTIIHAKQRPQAPLSADFVSALVNEFHENASVT